MFSARVFRRLLWGLTIVYWMALFVLTHIPQGQGPESGVGDKAAHLIAYGLLASALFACLWASHPRCWHAAWFVPAVCLAYGAIDEWLQAIPFINRSCELSDWYYDAFGVAIAMGVLIPIRWIVERSRRTNEARQAGDAIRTN